jgi:type VI secretion system protein ImpJ
VSVNNKVVWSEGMFLRPQHYQQQDRYMERYIDGRCSAFGTYNWGVFDLQIDSETLQLGKISIVAVRGVFPDGTPFSIPDTEELPAIFEVPENTRDETIYLCIPLRRAGAVDSVENTASMPQARYQMYNFEARNSTSTSGEAASIQIGKLNTCLKLGSDDLSGYATIAVARVVERQPDKPVKLDKGFIPPVLNCASSPVLAGHLEELKSMLKQRGDALGHRLTDSGRAGSAEIADYMLLQVINRVEPLITLLSTLEMVHPVVFYTELVQLSGELSTFTSRTKRPAEISSYQHNALRDSFGSVVASLRQSLSTVLEQTAVSLTLVQRKFGIYVAAITDRSLITTSNFVLAVKADIKGDTLRSRFPTQCKIAPVETIRNLISTQLPGLNIRALPVAPRQIPYHAGFTYFELEKVGDVWNAMAKSGGFAVHLGAEFPGIEMELWAMRDS